MYVVTEFEYGAAALLDPGIGTTVRVDDELEIGHDGGAVLTHLVVEFPGDLAAFFLLRAEQAPGEVAIDLQQFFRPVPGLFVPAQQGA